MDKWEKEFEERIRKKVSDAPVDFDPAAWERMEQRLYPAVSRGGWLFRRQLRAAAAIILLAAAGIWAYTTYFSPAPSPGNHLSSVSGDQPAATGPQPAGKEDAEKEQAAGKEGRLPGTSEGAPAATKDRTPAGQPGLTDAPGIAGAPARAGAPVVAKDPALVKKPALAGQPGLAGQRELAGKPGLAETGTPAGQFQTGGRQGAPAAVSTDLAAVGTGPVSGGFPAAGTDLPRMEARPPAKTAEGVQAVPKPGTVYPGGGKMSLSLGVLAAPDLNGVGGFSNSKAGINAGLDLGLHFNDRLSLHTGIVYSRKPYNALPSDYHPGYSPQDLVNVAALCDVIDIPLDLRYTVYRRGANSIALSAGLSSYLMLREKYDYQYGYQPERHYEYKNENRHFMGVGNFGVALDRKINEHMSVGLEPFIKVPLTGIGHGNVRLISAGAALRLNLDLSKKRKVSINKKDTRQ